MFNLLENFMWSGKFFILNGSAKCQECSFVLTDKCLYNIGDLAKDGKEKNLFAKFKSKFSVSFELKRTINIDSISYVTYPLNSTSLEIIIHIPNEYDYFLKGD